MRTDKKTEYENFIEHKRVRKIVELSNISYESMRRNIKKLNQEKCSVCGFPVKGIRGIYKNGGINHSECL
jgi:hypothetical protein